MPASPDGATLKGGEGERKGKTFTRKPFLCDHVGEIGKIWSFSFVWWCILALHSVEIKLKTEN